MKTLRIVQVLTGVLVGMCLPASSPLAEDTKGKWQFGFGLSYFSTTDYIRSNSDIAVATGVVGECEGGICPVGSVDERPDINMLNEPSIRDDFKLDFSASYGLTRWLAVEVAASYFKAPVGNIEYYSEDKEAQVPGSSVSDVVRCGPSQDQACWNYTTQDPTSRKLNKFLPVGELREIPIHASALIRFRPESPLDPYIGLGFGYIMTDLKTSEEFNRRASELGSLNVSTACEGEYTLQSCDPPAGKFNFTPTPLEANVKNAFEFHTVGGVDYYVSDRFSVYVDARYVWTSGAIDVRTDSAHQVRFAVVDEGQLLLAKRLYNVEDDPSSGPYLWEDTGITGCSWDRDGNGPGGLVSCAGDQFYQTEDKNVNGTLDPLLQEDNGVLYVLPPGSRDVNERISEIDCTQCDGNGTLDTEDKNNNQLMDRFQLYGYDICTTADWATNERCTQRTNQFIQYVWPSGCPQDPRGVTLKPTDPASKAESGCPEFPPFIPGNAGPDGIPNSGDEPRKQVGSTSGTDDQPDLFLVQGGRIRLGGFSLGVGFKFTF
jgi:outer membrane protein W